MKLVEKIEKSRSFWFLLLASFLFFLLRLPSLFEPVWFQDEGIYQTIGKTLHAGGKMYLDAWDNKPPLLFTIYTFFDGNQTLIKLLSLIFGVLSLILFFILSKKIFGEKIAFISSALFGLVLATPLIQGNIANTENFMILPIILAMLIFVNFIKNDKNKNLIFLSSFILGLAFLLKVLAIFDYLSVFIFLLFLLFPKIKTLNNLKPKIETLVKSVFLFFLPLIITSIYFLVRGSFREFSNALLLQNFSYVIPANDFLIPHGLLIIKSILLVSALGIIYVYKDKLKKEYVFIVIWYLFSLYNVFFSQRPYHHYLILLLPSLSIILFLSTIKKFRILFASLGLMGLVIVLFYFGPPKSLTYYANFIKFLGGNENLYTYRQYFGRDINKYYEIGKYVKANSKKSDKILIWGDDPQIYSISDRVPAVRYSVIYHMKEYDPNFLITSSGITRNKPKIVVIMSGGDREWQSYPFSLENYKLKITIMGADIYERFD